MRSLWRKEPDPKYRALATYLGQDSGFHIWEIEGQIYTDSVTTIGGLPRIGRVYPAWCNQPDSRSQWVVLVKHRSKNLPRNKWNGNWTHRRAEGGRSSRADWRYTDLGRIQSITGVWDFVIPDVRVWDGTIYTHMGVGDVTVSYMGDHKDPFFDEEDGFVGPHYRIEPEHISPLGSGVIDFILDPVGDLLFLWTKGISKANRSGLTTAFVTPITLDGHTLLPGTLFTAPAATETEPALVVIGCLSVKEHRLYMVRWDAADGAELDRILLEQTPDDALFDPTEPFAMVSGGTHDVGPYRIDSYASYWDPANPGAEHRATDDGQALNPWGFTNNEYVASTSFGALLGERRFGSAEESMPASSCYWGPPPADETEVLHFATVFGVVQSGGKIVPRPEDQKYLPTLVAYNADGSRAWEKLGWETTPAEAPYHYRDLFCPVAADEGKLVTVTLRLTFETIDEIITPVIETLGEWNNNPASPNYNAALPAGWNDGPSFDPDSGIVVDTVEYAAGTPVNKRSRRLVGIQTFMETWALSDGVRLASQPLVEQIVSKFPTRGAWRGTLPPRYGYYARNTRPGNGPYQTPATMAGVYDAFLGYTTSSYWPAASTYFSNLDSGDYYAYGLYSDGVAGGANSNRVTPVWPVLVGKPGNLQDPDLEGDQYYDTFDNQGYNRITKIPRLRPLGTVGTTSVQAFWVAEADMNNNGLVEDANLPPPSAWLYDVVWHETHRDMPHISNYFAPILNSARNLLIIPPLYALDFPFSALSSAGVKFDPAGGGSTSHYTWSGGSVANRMGHQVTIAHNDWKTDERQVWRAYNFAGELVWTHKIEVADFEDPITAHQFGRACCGAGRLEIVHRINGGPYRLRVVNDSDGGLISDEEMVIQEPHLPEGDNGGTPYETILAGDVSIVTTVDDIQFDWDTFEETVVGKPHVHGLYLRPPEGD